jgi:hypothetical protein
MSPGPDFNLRAVNAVWSQLNEWQRKKIYFLFRFGLFIERVRHFHKLLVLRWISIVIRWGNHEHI